MAAMVLVGNRCKNFLESFAGRMNVKDIQADEVWGFVSMKERTRSKKYPGQLEVGDAYCFVALERYTKMVIAWHLGRRSSEDAHEFSGKLGAATQGRFQVTTDGFTPYRTAIPANMPQADFAQLVKQYATKDDHKYSPGEVTGTVKTPCCGNPDESRICTSHVERSNLSLRMSIRRMTRLTNAFSKKWSNHEAALSLWFCFYNFCRPHQTLKQTPAMEAGLTDHVWNLGELLIEVAKSTLS